MGSSQAFSLNGFKSGEFQIAFEDRVDDCVPFKAACILGNAGIQRGAIGISSSIFGWNCYPTYYGSEFVVCPEEQRLFDMPDKATEELFEPFYATAEALTCFAGRNPEKNVYLYLAPDNQNVSGAPAAHLVANALSYSQMLEVFRFADIGVSVIDGGVSYTQFLDGWYKTDHHWNILGAYSAYARIAYAMGLQVAGGDVISYGDVEFRGTLARRSLDDDYYDVLVDIESDSEPNLLVTIDEDETGGSELLVQRDTYEEGRQGKNRFTSHYGEYFNFGAGMMTIENLGDHSGKELLLITDSFGFCLDRFFAENYEVVYVLDPRNSDKTANQLIYEHGKIDDILVLMCRSNLTAQSTIDALI